MKIFKSNYTDINKINLHDGQIVMFNYCFESESLEIEISLLGDNKIIIKLYNILGVKFSNACPWGGMAQDVLDCSVFLDMNYLLNEYDFPSRNYMIIKNDSICTSSNEKKIGEYFQFVLFLKSGDTLCTFTDRIEITES